MRTAAAVFCLPAVRSRAATHYERAAARACGAACGANPIGMELALRVCIPNQGDSAMKPILLRALVALALAGASLAAPAQTKIRFQLDWRYDGQSAPFLYGNCKGNFKAEGLDVQFDSGAGSGLAVQRVASGAYDMGFGDSSSLIEFIANNPTAEKVRAVYMTQDASPAGVMMLKKNGIGKPADLAGKTLGAPIFDAGRKLWPLFARAVGIDPAKVKWETMDPKLREQMLARGQVDAITGFITSGIISLNELGVKDEDIVYFGYKDYGVAVYGNAILASDKFIKENPKAVAAFLKAYNRTLKDALANPDAVIGCLKQREPIIDDQIELKRFRMLFDNYVMTPNVKAHGIGMADKKRLAAQVDDVVLAFGLKQRPDPEGLFDASFLPPAAERMVK
jgi:NitT/TauT family transport system substrate-binding protein